MGRRGKNHASVKYIILIDKNGNEDQRIELDNSGRLLHKFQKIKKIDISNHNQGQSPPPTVIPLQSDRIFNSQNANMNIRIPIPPMLRAKPAFAFLNLLNNCQQEQVQEPSFSSMT